MHFENVWTLFSFGVLGSHGSRQNSQQIPQSVSRSSIDSRIAEDDRRVQQKSDIEHREVVAVEKSRLKQFEARSEMETPTDVN
jgi:hypothetical protein